MSRCSELHDKAKKNPPGLRFDELCELAVCYGFEQSRTRGSHQVFKKAGYVGLMVFQEGKNGKAIPYQVRQLLRAIESTPEGSSS